MAALLKKRALAEFSQVLQEEQPRVPKRLRLVKKPSISAGFDIEHLKNASSFEALQFLLQFPEALTDDVDVQPLYHALMDHFHKEQDSAVRVKVITVLSQIVHLNLIEPPFIFDDLQGLLKYETSHIVKAQILSALHTTGKKALLDEKLHQRILLLAKEHLSDSSHIVKCSALSIIGDFTPIASHSDSFASTFSLIAEHSQTQEPRVRTEALNSLLYLHERGLKLDSCLYDEVSKALTDDYESVRMSALKLVEVISHLYAENLIVVGSGSDKIRLADDAFAKVCNMINDISINVRVLAASLLGKFQEVSVEFLEQTLDKKLMSNLRRKRTAHERQKESYESGEWSSGQKWANDAPKEAVDADNVSLISSGACGAFVHGLEDEFLEVRSATLDSLCHLAVQFPSFALLSLDFLVDMFNDEIEGVRLKAVHCLRKISRHIMLREDQLDTILCVLEDSSMDIREALHEMLGSCQLSTKACLKSCIDNLLENLKRYPQDKRSIWKCLQKLGQRHPYLTLPLVPELLGIHPFFDMPEPNVEDSAYLCILILIFNAASNCPTMIPLFEEHTLKHYSFLKDTLPSLVPHLRLKNQPADIQDLIISDEQPRKFLHKVLGRVAAAEHRNPAARQSLLETSIQDLQHLAEIDPKLSAAANCSALYIRCQLLLAKVISNKNWLNPSLLSPLQSSALKSSLEQLLQLSFRLSHQYLGLNAEEVLCLRQLRLRVLSLQLMVLIRGSNTSALGPCEAFLEQVDALQCYQEEQHLVPDSFTCSLFRDLDCLEDPKPGTVARILQPLLQSCPCPSLRLHTDSDKGLQRIKQASAVINEPSGESDDPAKFTAGLVLCITMDAEIENVEDVKNVKVKVKYPDQQVQLVLPRLADFRQHGELQYRLYTSLLLSHNIWSEACYVDVSLALDFSDTEGCVRASQKNVWWFKAEESTIELCKPVKVYISPKQAKKGI